jgi:hypothetical protein
MASLDPWLNPRETPPNTLDQALQQLADTTGLYHEGGSRP